MQASQQFVRRACLDQFAPARVFHCRDGFGIGIKRLEWQGFLRGNPYQKKAKCIRHSEADFPERSRGLPFGAFIDAGSYDGTLGHGVNVLWATL